MISIENSKLHLSVSEDGTAVTVLDKARRVSWSVDDHARRCYVQGRDDAHPLPPGRAELQGDAIVISHAFGDQSLQYEWTLGEDYAQVKLSGDASVSQASLPGPMFPAQGQWELAVPLYQGCMIQPSGKVWERVVGHGGHAWFSMAMGAVLAEKSTLVITHNSPTNWRAAYGETQTGPFVSFEHVKCEVDGWNGAEVRLYPCDAGLTSACKQYREVVKLRGDFKSWKEKIQAKPILKNLFGALIAFVGYNKTDEIDYVASAEKLKVYGFEKIFFYPVRMCHNSLDFQMGGDNPIWLSDEDLQKLHAIDGVYLSPWAWLYEGFDDGSAEMDSIFRQRDGKPVAGWSMDDNRWYEVCTPYQIELIRKRLGTDMKAMDWLHFDVNASIPGATCMCEDHSLHGNRPMGGVEDMAFTRQLLSTETVGNRIVSSEGFSDYHTSSYDIGATKIIPMADNQGLRMPVPMTMLVFHDSCVHDWWELQNYNAVPGWSIDECPNQMGRCGSGEPLLKAAIDALYGCPPNLFPFGKQYAWVDKPCGDTYPVTVRLEDDSVQQAVHAALPVAKLHEKIGPCEMTHFEFLSDDRYVQSTTFSDGTRIVANLSAEQRDIEGVGILAGHQWKQLDNQGKG